MGPDRDGRREEIHDAAAGRSRTATKSSLVQFFLQNPSGGTANLSVV
jgi:hypothetical protein